MASGRFFYSENESNNSDFDIEGIVLLKNNESFSEIAGSRVLIFEDTPAAFTAIEEFEKTKDIDIVFEAALQGHAEEISVSKLVQFYLENS